jgi:hypothetical protein
LIDQWPELVRSEIKLQKLKKQKDKKRVLGRSKKRLHYKRRIVNVDPKDKRKKGPNFGAEKKVTP